MFYCHHIYPCSYLIPSSQNGSSKKSNIKTNGSWRNCQVFSDGHLRLGTLTPKVGFAISDCLSIFKLTVIFTYISLLISPSRQWLFSRSIHHLPSYNSASPPNQQFRSSHSIPYHITGQETNLPKKKVPIIYVLSWRDTGFPNSTQRNDMLRTSRGWRFNFNFILGILGLFSSLTPCVVSFVTGISFFFFNQQVRSSPVFPDVGVVVLMTTWSYSVDCHQCVSGNSLEL